MPLWTQESTTHDCNIATRRNKPQRVIAIGRNDARTCVCVCDGERESLERLHKVKQITIKDGVHSKENQSSSISAEDFFFL